MDDRKVASFCRISENYTVLVNNQFQLAKYIGCSPMSFEDMPFQEFIAMLDLAEKQNKEQ